MTQFKKSIGGEDKSNIFSENVPTNNRKIG